MAIGWWGNQTNSESAGDYGDIPPGVAHFSRRDVLLMIFARSSRASSVVAPSSVRARCGVVPRGVRRRRGFEPRSSTHVAPGYAVLPGERRPGPTRFEARNLCIGRALWSPPWRKIQQFRSALRIARMRPIVIIRLIVVAAHVGIEADWSVSSATRLTGRSALQVRQNALGRHICRHAYVATSKSLARQVHRRGAPSILEYSNILMRTCVHASILEYSNMLIYSTKIQAPKGLNFRSGLN